VIVVAVAAVALIALLIVRSTTDRPDDILRNEAALTWTMRAAGGIVAAVAAFALLARALDGVPAERLVGLVLPLLGGALLAAAHWAVAAALGAVVVVLVVRRAGWGPATPTEAPRSED
jgi:hypothetical protein